MPFKIRNDNQIENGFFLRQKDINDACLFAESEYQRFISEGNQKLSERYLHLKQYLNDRKTKFWQ
jgi:hypothetical protein